MTRTKHSQVWHWYIHCSPLLNVTCLSSWCWHDSLGSHWGQQSSRSFFLCHFEQSHGGSEHVITPFEQVHKLQGWFRGVSWLWSEISSPSNMQLSLHSSLDTSFVVTRLNDEFIVWSVLHLHSKWPSVLTHVADGWQLWVFSKHSSISAQLLSFIS